MAREKFQTLTEQMFYILLCLQSECYGMDIMEKVRAMTVERVSVGPGTLYNLLESFVKAGMICETKVEGRRRNYLITDTGMQALETEYQRLTALTADYRQYVVSKGGHSDENNKTQI
ncbi:MAG: helix-turn-helix transcriptional regulator [Syntrophomonadaceae bacterium]|nr:helix-turn-helix transcriptional regulator [Syntrophomonadaceae bacterium]